MIETRRLKNVVIFVQTSPFSNDHATIKNRYTEMLCIRNFDIEFG